MTKNNFERLTFGHEPYTVKGKDGVVRNFAVCPACDNPIQIIGLYKELRSTDRPYAKHYNRDTIIAGHNERNYRFCPYASHNYGMSALDRRRESLTDFEREIYYCLRNNFDLALYILEQDTGIHISEKMARRMLSKYLSTEGYMYYSAALYNIPWILLHTAMPYPCFGSVLRKGTLLHKYMETRKDIMMKRGDRYDIVDKNASFLSLDYAAINHERRVVDDRLCETIDFCVVYIPNGELLPKLRWKTTLQINEVRFLNLINSEVAQKYRRQNFLGIAQEMMPDI